MLRLPTWARIPSLRAAVGATLVVTAAVGVLSAYSNAGRAPSTRFAVARRNLPAGHVLRRSDVGLAALTLPAGTSAVTSSDAASLIGRRTTAPLHRSDVIRSADAPPQTRANESGIVVPVAVDVERSLGAAISTGTVVSVLSTDTDAGGTVTVAEGAIVVAVDQAAETGDRSTQRLRLRVPTAAAATQLVDSAVRSTLTLTLPSQERREPSARRAGEP